MDRGGGRGLLAGAPGVVPAPGSGWRRGESFWLAMAGGYLNMVSDKLVAQVIWWSVWLDLERSEFSLLDRARRVVGPEEAGSTALSDLYHLAGIRLPWRRLTPKAPEALPRRKRPF